MKMFSTIIFFKPASQILGVFLDMLVMWCGNNMFFNIIGFDFTVIYNFELLHCDVLQSVMANKIHCCRSLGGFYPVFIEYKWSLSA